MANAGRNNPSTKSLRVQVDSLPRHFHEFARDWSDISATRLLSEPLFIEAPHRTITTTVVDSCAQLDSDTWRLSLQPDASRPNLSDLSARNIAQQICRARSAKAGGQLSSLMIKSLVVESPSSLRVTTRLPVAHLNRILANPTLAPRPEIDGATFGRYVLESRNPNSIVFRAVDETHFLEMLANANIPDSNESLDSHIDVSGPMSIRPKYWPVASQKPFTTTTLLDIFYTLILPENIPAQIAAQVHSDLDRSKVCAAARGMVIPAERFTSNWFLNQGSYSRLHSSFESRPLSDVSRPSAVLQFTRFPGNQEIAASLSLNLSSRLDIQTHPVEVEYEPSITPLRSDNIFRLVLYASPWPHPAALLMPFYFDPSSSHEFRAATQSALREPSLTKAKSLAQKAEDILVGKGVRFVPIGRVNGCVRSRLGHLWCPPSGWIDYYQIANR